MMEWTDPDADNEQAQRSLAANLLSFSSASIPAREALAAGNQLGVVGLLLFVTFPDRFSAEVQWLILAGTVMYFAIRVVSSVPKWRRHAERLGSAGSAAGSLFKDWG